MKDTEDPREWYLYKVIGVSPNRYRSFLYSMPSTGQDWDAIERTVTMHPEDAAVPLFDGVDGASFSLHHIVCCDDPPLRAVQAVLDAYPAALFLRACPESLEHPESVLQLACRHSCSPDVVRFLIRQILLRKEEEGHLSHFYEWWGWVCQDYRVGTETFKVLLEEHPKSLSDGEPNLFETVVFSHHQSPWKDGMSSVDEWSLLLRSSTLFLCVCGIAFFLN